MAADLFLLYATLATAAATLTGLLFVALSFVAGRTTSKQAQVGLEIQAAGCMLCFIDVLAVTLFGLAGVKNVGATAVILGVVGLLYAFASFRSLQLVKGNWRDSVSHIGFLIAFTILFALQLASGLHLASKHGTAANDLLSFSKLPIIMLLVGVARTWQLIGLRDTGVLSSLLTLFRIERRQTRKKK